MTESIREIYRLLRPLRLYRLGGDTLVDAELAAYDAGFALVEAALDALEREAFLQTAEDYGLTLREEAMRLWLRPGGDPENRRALLLSRLAVSPDDRTPAGTQRSVLAAGLYARLVEDLSGERVRIVGDSFLSPFADDDALEDAVKRMMPAHLEIDFEIGSFTWDQFEAAGASFDDCDAKDAAWGSLDLDGAEIFGGDDKHA